jgi:D-3-phosphoglycerate dehydrogenase
VTVKVFLVDPRPLMMPYSYEIETIRAAGGELVIGDCSSEDDVVAQAGAAGAEILLVAGKPLVTGRVLSALPKVRYAIRMGVGYDVIDADAATERGVAVGNAPTYCGDEVAEHAIALLMAVARRIVWAHERIRAGGWVYPGGPIHRLTGKTLGIIGCGNIGSKVAARAQGLGMKVIAYDKFRPDEELRAIGVEPVSFDEALSRADYVTLHVLLNAGTRGLIDAAALAKMKPDAMLVNTSRGPVVDQEALADALESGHLAGAALDVFEVEPLVADSRLRTMEHVILTPHSASYSIEAIQTLREEVCANVAEWIQTGWASNVRNPEVREFLRPRETAG